MDHPKNVRKIRGTHKTQNYLDMKELLNGITDKKIIAKRKKENPKRERRKFIPTNSRLNNKIHKQDRKFFLKFLNKRRVKRRDSLKKLKTRKNKDVQ